MSLFAPYLNLAPVLLVSPSTIATVLKGLDVVEDYVGSRARHGASI